LVTNETAKGQASDSTMSVAFLVVVGLLAGAIIAGQISIMRIFAIGTWTHFGSLVVSIAMLAFGLTSAMMCIGTKSFERHLKKIANISLLAFGPLMALGNTAAQTVGFNPIELVDDPGQRVRLLVLFILYFVPFIPGALFLGLAFLRGRHAFGRVYFADLAGSGLCGMLFLLALYVVPPERIMLVPLALWLVAAIIRFRAEPMRHGFIALALCGCTAVWLCLSFPQLVVNEYKGVSYANKFPDSVRIHEEHGPFGLVEVFGSSYFHFAAGLSDNAALNLEQMPKDAYLGLYVDSDGPIGIMKKLPPSLEAYFRYLPIYLPYVIKSKPDVFAVQYGGGISTQVALAAGASRVTVAEGNPQILHTLRDEPAITALSGNPLSDPRVTVIPFDGRLHISATDEKYDVIDLSLADATGLSAPGGFSIIENYNYTIETMRSYMDALKPGGVLSVTIWNKQDLPKAVPKLLATMTAAAWERDGEKAANRFFVTHTYLSTLTVLYKNDGFSAAESGKLQEHLEEMSFGLLYRPGQSVDPALGPAIFQGFRRTHFPERGNSPASAAPADGGAPESFPPSGGPAFSWDNLYRVMLDHFLHGRFGAVADGYVFDTRPLTNDRPYFAGYVKPGDVPHFLGAMGEIKDEWGYLLLWMTLFIATGLGGLILLLPVVTAWRTVFQPQRGKLGLMLYFLCLGAGYIAIEVGLIGQFLVALGNPTISASVLITGMLLFSGIGALFSGRILDRCRTVMPGIFAAIAVLLVLGAFFYDQLLIEIGQWPNYVARMTACVALLAPAAFLMGFPFPTAMAMLSRLGKDRFFIWAWGINGTFSVIGAVAVPILSVTYGQSVPILSAAVLYLIAWPAFYAVLAPPPGGAPSQR
jgi:hypothetical protein